MPAEHALDALRRAEQRHGSLLRAALARHRSGGETAPPASFDDGLQVLPRALYREHRPYVHLDAPVTSIDRVEEADTSNDGSGAESEAEDAGPGYQLRAGGRTVTVDEVVLTTPAPTAASLLGDLEGARTAGLADLTYNSLVLVHLLSDADVSGFGYQVRREEPLETRGVTWNASLFGRQHSGGQGSGERPSDGVYTAFLGGMSDPDAVDRSDDELGSVAAREFEAVVGAPAAVLSVERLPAVLPAYDESWAALDDVETPDGVHLAANYASRLGIASRVREAERLADELLGAVPARN